MPNLNFIFSILGWLMTIGVAGGLVDLTIDMAHHAWHADHIGLVSMRSLTRSLMVPDETVRILKYGRHNRHP